MRTSLESIIRNWSGGTSTRARLAMSWRAKACSTRTSSPGVMPETFLILLAGGVMLAAVVSDPRQVTLNWLRLCGILALCFAGLGIYFALRPSPLERVGIAPFATLVAFILAQLGFTQLAF